jgi:hypothetical protein
MAVWEIFLLTAFVIRERVLIAPEEDQPKMAVTPLPDSVTVTLPGLARALWVEMVMIPQELDARAAAERWNEDRREYSTLARKVLRRTSKQGEAND